MKKENNINRRNFVKSASLTFSCLAFTGPLQSVQSPSPDLTRPNIILVMTDDQGWGQTGYYNHPILKTPNIDAMAANGLRFDRFYAGAPVCSPTRASVLTGRANDRTGVPSHGYALRLQEKTLPAALKKAGYATGHFGKWHLNGLRGPGVPVLKEDNHNPGAFGFDYWLTVSNFFDMNPVMSRNGNFEEFKGDSSAIIVDEAVKFIRRSVKQQKPFFSVIWDGSPHSPWVASKTDREPFSSLTEKDQHHYGELKAFDRSLGKLRRALRDMDVAENTIVWYCSDNGGLPNHKPDTTGGLRGYKGSVWEGGLRVPGIIEWPAVIKPRITGYPACTMDIFPTITELLNLPGDTLLNPVDGISLKKLLINDLKKRPKPIPFRYNNTGALVDNDFKLVATNRKQKKYQLFNMKTDPKESKNIAGDNPQVFEHMVIEFEKFSVSVDNSIKGLDYPEKSVRPDEPESHQWTDDDRYKPYFKQWKKRPEYAGRLKNY